MKYAFSIPSVPITGCIIGNFGRLVREAFNRKNLSMHFPVKLGGIFTSLNIFL